MSEQRVLITGGTSGIGLATARLYASEGARVAVLARKAAGLQAARRQTAAAGAECLAFAVDVTEREALREQIGHAVGALGGLDVAVVNVGASTYGRFRDTPARDFDRVVEVSFRSAVDTVREVLPHLERSGGALVVVGSLVGAAPLPRMAAYTAAKHGLRGFVETLRIELATEGSSVAVSLVEPGPVDTPFWDNVASADGLLAPTLPLTYRPEEVALAIEASALRRSRLLTVGGAWALARTLYRVAPALGERVVGALIRATEQRARRGAGRAAIWNPAGEGELRLGMSRRPSLLVRSRLLAARLRRSNRARSRRGGAGGRA